MCVLSHLTIPRGSRRRFASNPEAVDSVKVSRGGVAKVLLSYYILRRGNRKSPSFYLEKDVAHFSPRKKKLSLSFGNNKHLVSFFFFVLPTETSLQSPWPPPRCLFDFLSILYEDFLLLLINGWVYRLFGLVSHSSFLLFFWYFNWFWKRERRACYFCLSPSSSRPLSHRNVSHTAIAKDRQSIFFCVCHKTISWSLVADFSHAPFR